MYVQKSDGFDGLSNMAGPKENAEKTGCEFGTLA